MRILWDKYETALLIETYLRIISGDIDRKTGVSQTSKELRRRAADAGKEIDNIYRNENGISFQLGKIERLMSREADAQKHNTKIFIDMVDMYFYDKDQFNSILEEAKEGRSVETRQDRFFAWLSKEVPSFRMSDYFLIIGDLENFARKKRLLNGSFFDIDDPAITGKIVTAIKADKLFRFNHKKNVKIISDLAQYFDNYTRIQAVSKPTVRPETVIQTKSEASMQLASEPKIEKVSLIMDQTFDTNKTVTNADFAPIDTKGVPKKEPEGTNINHEFITTIQEKEEFSAPKEPDSKAESHYTVDFLNETDYAFTQPVSVSYFDEISYLSSWRAVYARVCHLLFEDYPDDFKSLRDSDGAGSGVYKLIHDKDSSSRLRAPVKIADGYFVETNRSASDLMRNIKLLLDHCRVDYENLIITYKKNAEKKEDIVPVAESVQKPIKEKRGEMIPADPVLAYLEQNNLEFIDLRHKLGCLWIIGGREITDKMEILHKSGVKMHFRAGGGNATGGRAAWWTKDKTNAPIGRAINNEKVQMKPLPKNPDKAGYLSGAAATQSTAATKSTLHPGRVEFECWLKETNCPSGSIKTYADGIERVGKYLLDNNLDYRNIFSVRGVARLEKIRERLLSDKLYSVKTGAANARLDCYALKKYIAFRKNDSSDNVEDASVEHFATILKENFVNGFRITSMIDRNRFKQFYADAYGEELPQTDDEILNILKQIGSIQDNRIFLRESSAQNDLLDDIQAEIAEVFASGISCVYLTELFARHQDELTTQLQVFTSDVLKELLLSTSYDEYRANKNTFYLKGCWPDTSADIKKIMQRSSVPLSYSDIYEKLRFTPFDTIRHSLVVMDKMVNVAQETYFFAPNLPVSADELNRIAELIHGQLSQKSFLTDLEMRTLIETNCPSVAINTEDFTTWGLRNCLSVLLGDRFAFNGPIISEKGQALNTSQVFTEFSRSHEAMTLDELKAFAKDINNGIIYWDSVMEVMVRTSSNEFARKDQITFDVDAVDGVIDTLLDGDYASLKSFQLFLHFPAISVKWNEFVLESFVSGYSKKFSLMHASYTATECRGGIVRKESEIKNFQDLVEDVLAHSDAWETKDDALALLVKEGYLQRRHYTKIDTIIPQAKLQRERIQSAFEG